MKQIGDKKIFSPSEVNAIAKETLQLLNFWVEGEVAEFEQVSNYNFYRLSLKDQNSILPCVVSGDVIVGVQAEIKGKRVLAYGNLSLWEPRGLYQFKIYRIEEAGEGIFQKELEELKKKLMAEGLFDEKYKKPIPEYPTKICLVTSYRSAAWNDFVKHTVGEFANMELYTADVRVQGKQSVGNLLSVLPKIDRRGFDVIVVTRGGGSIEDLVAFNDERVTRAIFKLKTPTIVAIGHEHNQSLAEWVADARASTPSAAAFLITQQYQKLLEKLQGHARYFNSKFEQLIYSNMQSLSYLQNRLQSIKVKYEYLPEKLDKLKENIRLYQTRVMEDARNRLEVLQSDIKQSAKRIFTDNFGKLDRIARELTVLSPDNTLKRGYSLTLNSQGEIIRSVNAVVVGADIKVKLFDGSIFSKVKSKTKDA